MNHECKLCLKIEECKGNDCDFREEFEAHGECLTLECLK